MICDFRLIILDLGRHLDVEQIKDRILDELFGVIRQIKGGVLTHADHNKTLFDRDGAIGRLRYRRGKGGETRLRPFGDSGDGVGVALREELYLPFANRNTGEENMRRVAYGHAEILGVDGRTPVPYGGFEQKRFEQHFGLGKVLDGAVSGSTAVGLGTQDDQLVRTIIDGSIRGVRLGNP